MGDGRILVVDDNPSILSVVSDALVLEGYGVETAANGAEALCAVERALPSLVVLDMRMPILNGWQFLAELRARHLDVPVLVMTAACDARCWAEEVEADGFLSKPFELDELLSAVGRLRGAPTGQRA